MRCIVKSGNQEIGIAEFAGYDRGMGVAIGSFHPAAAYASVREVFLLFGAALRANSARNDSELLTDYYRARDALDLTLWSQSGREYRVGWIHIADFEEEAVETSPQIEAQVEDSDFWGAAVQDFGGGGES